jgi:hypothetical protein
MKIPHTIRADDTDWEEWISKHIGEKNKDYSIIIEHYEEYHKDGVTLLRAGSNAFWEIPDTRKAILFALRFS